MKRVNTIWLVVVMIVLIACESAWADLTDELIAHWKLDEGEGDIAYDLEGGNHGTLMNGPLWTTGLIDGALEFDGEDDYVELGTSDDLDDLPLNDMTVSAWIYDEHTGGTTWGTIAGCYANNHGWSFRTFSNASGDRSLYFQVPHSGGNYDAWAEYGSVDGTILANNWYHTVAVWDAGTKTAKLYINGEQPLYQTTTPGTGTYNSDVSRNKEIGRIPHVGGIQYFKGMIDDVRIYDRALSAEEVEQLYQDGVGGLIAHWKLDEGEGDIAYDSAGENHGTLVNGPTWTTGQIGGALEFDGVDDYVSAGAIPELRTTDSFTWSFWVNLASGNGPYYIIVGNRAVTTGSHFIKFTPTRFEYYNYGHDGTINYSVPINRWVHLVVVKDAAYLTYYSDASVVGTGIVSQDMPSNPLYFAGDPDYGEYAACRIDDVRIYNRALSAEEVEQLYLDSFGQFISLEIVGPNTVAENFQAQYEAIAHYERADVDVTCSALWSVDDEAVATIDENGLLTTVEINQPQKDIVISAEYTKGEITASDDKNVTVFAICPSGTALEFDGQNDYVNCGSGVAFPTENSDRTLMAWIKTTGTGYGQIISYGTAATSQAMTLGQNSGRVFVSSWGSPQYSTSDFSINDGNWHHIAFVLDSQIGKVYVNGVLKDSRPFSPNTALGQSKIGSRLDGATEFFDGNIDDVRIYDKALSAEEIQMLMHNQPDIDDPSLVAYWDFDDGEGQILADVSSNGNNGTLGSTEDVDDSDPSWIDSDAPVGICTPCEFAKRELISAYEYKMNIMQELQAAMDKEENALAALLELFRNSYRNRNRDFCGLSRRDVIGARINISQSIDREETGRKELEKSIERLKDALMYLGIDDKE